MKSPFLTAEWRKLAIANYAVDPAILRPFIPYKTELDLWQNKCYVSLVGFMFLNTRIKGIRIPFHEHFEEVNLRFYLRYKENGEWKRGVCFIREIVPRHALTFVANALYNEKYMTLPMAHEWYQKDNRLTVSYKWKHKKDWYYLTVNADPISRKILPGSEEEFITEHYWGYTRIDNKVTSEYGVEHPRWETYKVNDHDICIDFGKMYGSEFAYLNEYPPDSVMLAEGSEIIVRSAGKIR